MINFLVELKKVCDKYDAVKGDYPESCFEGQAVYEFAVEQAAKQMLVSVDAP